MLKKHKNKIIAAVVILAALSAAWFWGGNYNRRDPAVDTAPPAMAQDSEPQSSPSVDTVTASEIAGRTEIGGAAATPQEINSSPSETVSPHESQEVSPEASVAINSSEQQGSADTPTVTDTLTVTDSSTAIESPTVTDTPTVIESPASADLPTAAVTTDVSTPPQSPSPAPDMEINPGSGLDLYQTSQIPDGGPAPVEPQDMIAGDGSFTVMLTVRCDMILENMNLLNSEKHELIPKDGIIFPVAAVTAYEGESVFNVLQREMRRAGIHMAFRNTPIYNSAYIEAINNLYEFDVGELSGWMYKVNGWFPNYGSSRYQLQPGDVIEWHYTCDLGRDLGEYQLSGGWGQMDD